MCCNMDKLHTPAFLNFESTEFKVHFCNVYTSIVSYRNANAYEEYLSNSIEMGFLCGLCAVCVCLRILIWIVNTCRGFQSPSPAPPVCGVLHAQRGPRPHRPHRAVPPPLPLGRAVHQHRPGPPVPLLPPACPSRCAVGPFQRVSPFALYPDLAGLPKIGDAWASAISM